MFRFLQALLCFPDSMIFLALKDTKQQLQSVLYMNIIRMSNQAVSTMANTCMDKQVTHAQTLALYTCYIIYHTYLDQ